MVNTFINAFRFLLPSANIRPEEIVRFQNRQLRRIVNHAYETVPYYRQLFCKAKLKPEDIRGVDELPLIPITTKQDLIDRPLKDYISNRFKLNRLISHETHGTSGEPFTVFRTWKEERLLQMFRRRMERYLEIRISDRKAKMIGHSNTHPRNRNRLHQIAKILGLLRETSFDCSVVTKDIVDKLCLLKPDIISGYPGAVAQISEMIASDKYGCLKPRMLLLGGEILTPLIRNKIEKIFHAPVYDSYGSQEFNLIAWECKITGEYHTSDDSVIVEVIKGGRTAGQDEQGMLVGTALHSFAMPFLRYGLQDLVTRGRNQCLCGQPFSTIHSIQGRETDYFVMPDGKLVHPYVIVDILLLNRNWIKQYQLIQERENRIKIRIVALRNPSPSEISGIEHDVCNFLDQKVQCDVCIVDEILPDSGGKYRIYCSMIDSRCN